MQNMIVTIFKNIRTTAAGYDRDVHVVFDRIRSGKSKAQIEKIRATKDKETANRLKMELPSICFSGTFKQRSVQGLVKHSGLICLDFDGFEDDDTFDTWRDTLQADEYTFAMFTSPRGNGIKVITKIPDDPNDHKAYFDAIMDKWDCPYFDKGTSDVSRVCYESYDPNIYINEDAKVWDMKAEPDDEHVGKGEDEVRVPMTSESGIVNRLDVWFNRKYGMSEGERNNNLYRFANALNSFGISRHVAEQHLLNYAQKDLSEREIITLVKSAYKKTDRHATRFFEDDRMANKVEKLIRSGKSEKDIIRLVPEIKDSPEVVDNVKDAMTVTDYWHYNEKGRIQLSPHKYKFFLEQNQFCKFYPEDSSSFLFVKIDSNLIEDTTPSHIKDYVLNDLMSRSDIGYTPYDYMASQTRLFKEDYLSMLDTADVSMKKDDENTCHLYFRNCVLVINQNSIEKIDYIDLDGFVWKKHIIDRDYVDSDGKEGMFQKFIRLIAGGTEQRYNSLRSIAGYLLHGHKTSSHNKAIIFNDETISDNPNGGSGKGLFCRAIGHMKRVATLDGKQFSFDKSFPYQTVGADTQVLVFDDVRKNFAFEQLFSLITEGITLEKKNKDAIFIPVQRSPKLVITTNYTIGGIGGSFERRKFEVELSSYFGAHHTPFDEFGAMMFDDWDDKEWSRFHSFMVGCVQYYLKHGLVAHEFNNLELRKFIKETSSEFVEWATPENLPIGARLNKATKYHDFIEEYEDLKKWLTQRKFTSWMEAYGKRHGYKVQQGKTISERWILFEKEEPKQEGIDIDEIDYGF